MKMIALLVIASLCLVACVSSSTTMLDDRTAVISGRGSGFSNSASVIQSMLVEAAKTTKTRGFQYFAVTGAQDTTQTGAMYIPGQTQTYGTGMATANRFGNSAVVNGSYQATTYSTPGYNVPIVKPGADAMIHMYYASEIQPGQSGIWNADSILAQAAHAG